MANSADPDAAVQKVKGYSPRSGPFIQPTLRDNRPTSTISALNETAVCTRSDQRAKYTIKAIFSLFIDYDVTHGEKC